MDNTSNMCYCLKCDKRQSYKVLTRKDKLDIRGKTIEYDENYAVCTVCGDEMYVPKVTDSNIDSVQKAYDKIK